VARTARHRRSYYEYNYIFYRALERAYACDPFDILRVHSPYSVGPGALLFARRVGVPAVLHYLHVEARPLWQAVDRWTLRRYAHIITISAATKADLVRHYGLADDAITVAHPGVSERYSPGDPSTELRSRWGSHPVLLYVGSLIARKNLGLALEAVRDLAARGTPVRLVVAGTGPDETRLRALAGQLGVVAAVEFVGRVSEQLKLALLRSADIFLFPSSLEGFGMAPAEAMACGLPVVALAGGSVGEFVQDGVSGCLVDPDAGVTGFVAAIDALLGDRDLRLRVAQGGRAQTARMTWRRSAAIVRDAYAAAGCRASR
jgi:glycosyltransferase involved in cell wall biosynthesis